MQGESPLLRLAVRTAHRTASQGGIAAQLISDGARALCIARLFRMQASSFLAHTKPISGADSQPDVNLALRPSHCENGEIHFLRT